MIYVRPTGGDGDRRPDLSFERAGPEHASLYARDIGTDSSASFGARLSDDTWCYLVIADGRAVHATWCTTTAAWTREIGAFLMPPEKDAYVYESFTRPEVRGRGMYPFALGQIAADLGGRGVTRVWVGVEAANAASGRAVTKAGFEPAFEIGYRRRWGRIEVDTDVARDPESLHIAAKAP